MRTPDKDSAYWPWVREQAAAVGGDGCSHSPDIYVDCCHEHDLAYRVGRDPRDAWVKGSWREAIPIDKATADKRLRQCQRSRSPLRWFSPIARIYYRAVSLFGRWRPKGPDEFNLTFITTAD
jgi:hypothetical protein